MRVLVGWKIWYNDGSQSSSENNKWIEVKQNGVELVKLFYRAENGNIETELQHQEYYILDDLLPLPKEIKIGKHMDDNEFWVLFNKVKAETEIVKEMI